MQKSTLPPDALSGEDACPQDLVSSSSVEDDALGDELQAVCELERGAVIHKHAGLPQTSGFDDPPRLDAFLDAARWGAGSSADDQALQAPFPVGIAIKEYRLDPAVRARRTPRVNILVADDVVLGRTIETVLIAHELMLRHHVSSILIARPSSIPIPWRSHKRHKFEQQGTTLQRQIPNLRRTRDLLLLLLRLLSGQVNLTENWVYASKRTRN
ncbi:MAG: hypothetical protein KF833_10235 [Verrucomicrobiae bacterium]|nr:hypothetical protein [Verrucomicrobiae bacterium]